MARAIRKVTNFPEGLRVRWARIRKKRAGAGWSRICKVVGGKDEAGQGFGGLGLGGRWPGHKGAAAPLWIPRQAGRRGPGLENFRALARMRDSKGAPRFAGWGALILRGRPALRDGWFRRR